MKQVSLSEAKRRLSSLVEEVAAGSEIVVTRKGKPIAKIVPPERARLRRTPEFGFWEAHGYEFPPDFDAPDPEIEALFYGDDGGKA